MMIKSPCLFCKDRNIICHSVCDKYIDFRKELDDFNTENNKIKHVNQDIIFREIKRGTKK